MKPLETALLLLLGGAAPAGAQDAPSDLAAWAARLEGHADPAAFADWLLAHPGSLAVAWRPWPGGFSPQASVAAWEGSVSSWRAVPAQPGRFKGLSPANALFDAELSVSSYEGALRLGVTLRAARRAESSYQTTLFCPFDPASWTRQFLPKIPYELAPSSRPMVAQYLSSDEDLTYFSRPDHSTYLYPFGALENERGFLLWGAIDVGEFAILSPNHVARAVPSMTRLPKAVEPGARVGFDLALKWFPKPACRYRDVLRWYLASMRSSDPLLGPGPLWDGVPLRRTLGAGNIGSFFGPLARPAERPAWLAKARALSLGGLWAYGWLPETEDYPAAGAWKTRFQSIPTAASLFAEHVAWLQREGIGVYLYARNYAPSPRSPYFDPSWLGVNEAGAAQRWRFGADLGAEPDFGDARFRSWYEGRLKAAIRAYRPAGLAWDMGWWLPASNVYSRADPATTNRGGQLRVQRDIRAWIGREFPGMKVISNAAAGTPSQLYADAVMIELGRAGPAAYGELDFEAAKALGTSLLAFQLNNGANLSPRVSWWMSELANGLSIAGFYGAGTAELPAARFPELFRFSARTTGAPLLVGSHDVRVSDARGAPLPPAAAAASAWADEDTILVAAYAPGAGGPVRIQVAGPALRQAGALACRDRLAREAALQVLDSSGRPAVEPSARASLTERGLEIVASLRPGEALLYAAEGRP